MPVINNGSQHDRIMDLQNRIQYAAKMVEAQALEDKKIIKATLTGIEYSRYTPIINGPNLFTPKELAYVLENHRTNDSKIVLALIVSSFAGNGYAGKEDGTGIQASFYQSQGMTTDSAGNIYVSDTANNLIRKITPQAVVTTYAGNGVANYVEGAALSASFNIPQGIVIDSAGNLYVADTGNNVIRKITSGGQVSTIAGSGSAAFANGTGTSASFNGPTGMTIDSSGNLYVVDTGNNRIRKIVTSVSPAVVSTISGLATAGSVDGSASVATFNAPQGIAIDSTGSLYVTDTSNHRIRKIAMTPSPTVISTLAGATSGSADGTGTSATFNRPRGITIDATGNIFVADTNNYEIRKITQGGVVTTFAGLVTNAVPSDGSSATAGFSSPVAIAVDASGNLYVADNGNNTIKKLITYVVPNIPLGGPSSPTALVAYPGNAFINLVWSPPALSESSGLAITGYSITASPALPSQPIVVKDTFARITGLTNGTLYIFSVSAVNSLGSSSATATATPLISISATVPNPPTSVSAVRDNKAAIVSWTAPTNNGGSPITGYKVTFVSGGVTAFSTVVASTATSAPAVGLLNGTTYTVSIFALNNYGASTAGTTTVTPAAVSYAPYITSSTYADHSAILNWIPNTPSGVVAPTGFTIFYKLTSGGSESSTSYGASLRTATITGLTNNVQYTFRIIATNPVGQSPSSQLVNVTPNPTAPSSITVGTLTPKDQSAVVRWTAPYNGGAAITSYTITAIDTSNNTLILTIPAAAGSPTAAETALLSAAQSSAVSWKVNGLTNGTSYRFTVLAANGYPNANGQATATPISTNSAIPLRVTPDPVTAVTTVAGNYQVTVTWPALDLNTWTVPGTPGAAGEEVTKYMLTVCDSTGAALSTITPNPIEFTSPSYINATPGSTLSQVVTGLTNVNYIFKVSSFNSIGESAATSSSPVMALVEPAKPTNLSASPNTSETSITLAWTPPPNGVPGTPSITKYLVNVYDTDCVTLLSVYDPTPSITNTPCAIPGLTKDHQYCFSIIARNSVGDSPESDKVMGTPIIINPSIPQNVSASLSGDYATDANLFWSASTGSIGHPVTGYTIIARNTTDSTESSYSATNSPYIVSGLTTGKSYTFKIKSINDVALESAFSPVTSPITTGIIAQPVITSVDQKNSGNKKVNFSVAYGSRMTNIEYKLYSFNTSNSTTATTTVTQSNISSNSNILQFMYIPITSGITYNFYMTYRNTSTNQESSPSNTFTVTGATIPGSVSVTSLTPQDSYITINWNPPSSTGNSPINYYIITAYYSNNTVASTQNTSDSFTSFNYTGLLNGVPYKFKIQAVNDVGTGTLNSNYSSSATPFFTTINASTPTSFSSNNSEFFAGQATFDNTYSYMYILNTDGNNPTILNMSDYTITQITIRQNSSNTLITDLGLSYGIAVDTNGNIYLGDKGGYIQRLNKESFGNYRLDSFGGNGKIYNNTDIYVMGLVFDTTYRYLYAILGKNDTNTSAQIVQIDVTNNYSTNIISSINTSSTGGWWGPYRAITRDSNNNLYVADNGSSCIRKFTNNGDQTSFTHSVYAGVPGSGGSIDGIVSQNTPRIQNIITIAVDSNGNVYFTEDTNGNKKLRVVYNNSGNTIVGTVFTNSGNGFSVNTGNIELWSLAIDNSNYIYLPLKYSRQLIKLQYSI